ncbi:MutS2 protein (fragment) [Capnocytophaga canimorsus]
MEKTSEALKDEEIKAREEAKRLEELNQKIKSKLINYQELYDYNQRMIALGNKINDLAEKYFENGKKRPLISEFLRIVETENSKRKKVDEAEKIRHKELKKETEKELSKKIEEIRKQRKAEKKEKALKVEKEKQQMQRALKVNDRVRIKDSRSVGSIDKIEKGKAVINYGLFTTTVDIDQLELVEKVKN